MTSNSPNGVGPNSSNQALSEDAGRVFRRGWRKPAMSVALRYGLTLISVSVALVLAQTFLYYGLPLPFTAFALSAIAITFWYVGTNPGIVAVILSTLARSYFFSPAIAPFSRMLYDSIFLVFALVMFRITRTRNRLEVEVAEQTVELAQTNTDLKLEIAERNRPGTSDEALARLSDPRAVLLVNSQSGRAAVQVPAILEGVAERFLPVLQAVADALFEQPTDVSHRLWTEIAPHGLAHGEKIQALVQNTGDELPHKQGDPVRVNMPAEALRVLTDTGTAPLEDDARATPRPTAKPAKPAADEASSPNVSV